MFSGSDDLEPSNTAIDLPFLADAIEGKLIKVPTAQV